MEGAPNFKWGTASKRMKGFLNGDENLHPFVSMINIINLRPSKKNQLNFSDYLNLKHDQYFSFTTLRSSSLRHLTLLQLKKIMILHTIFFKENFTPPGTVKTFLLCS